MKKAPILKRLRVVVIILMIVVGGVAALKWWLPGLLNKPSKPAVVKMPPGAKPAGGPEQKAEDIPIAVRTFKASKIQFTDMLPVLGTIRGQSEVNLKFEVNGAIKSVDFREGDLVSKGQILATLDDKDERLRVEFAESKLRTAEAQRDLAQKRFSINEELYKIGAIIRPKYEESELELKQAETQVTTAAKETELAEQELDKTILRAPIDGVMGTREAEVGEYVTPQAQVPVATLMEVGSVFVELGIIERDIERLRLGQRVKISVDSVPNATFEGKVDNLAPLIEGKSRTLTAKVKVANSKGQLLPGMFARAEVAVYEKPDALVVPTSALKDTDGDGKFDSVFVVDGGVAKLAQIALGYMTTDYAEIVNGLAEGTQVVTEARGALKDGSKVTLLEEEESAVQRAEPKFGGKKGEEEGPH